MIMPKTKMCKAKGSRFWRLFQEKDGKYKVVFKSESKAEVKKKRTLIQAGVIDGAALIDKRTFVDVYQEFTNYKMAEARHETLGGKYHSMKSYTSSYNKWIKPFFPKEILVSEVTADVAIEFFKKIIDNGSSWINADKVVKSFKTALKYALRKQYISPNAFAPMNIFKARKEPSLKAKDPSQMSYKETPTITLQEAKLLLKVLCPRTNDASINQWRNFAIASTFVFCGLRMSELRAIRWHNIDFNLKKLSIKQTIVGSLVGNGKTKAALRTFTIHPLLEDVLKKWRKIHYGYFKDSTSWVFPSLGHYQDLPVPVCERTIRDFLNLAFGQINLASCKLVPIKEDKVRKRVVVEWSKFGNNPTRIFRHFSSTSLVQAQAGNPVLDDNFIRNYQGHEDIKTTRKIYAHHLNTDVSTARIEQEAQALKAAIPITAEDLQ